MRALALVALSALMLGSGGFAPPDRLVFIPFGGVQQPEALPAYGLPLDVCLDAAPASGSWSASTRPTLYAFNAKVKFGQVTPGTCAWVDGYAARYGIRLGCETPGLPRWLGPVAVESYRDTTSGTNWAQVKARCAAPGGVPPGQDFR